MITKTPKIMPYKYILLISMLFITIDLSAVSVAYKLVSFNHYLKINSAATFIFPVTYALGDIVTEVYGYSMARKLIWFSLLLQLIFALLVTMALYLPSPEFWKENSAFYTVFGSTMRFVFAGTVANLVSNFINIYIVSKLKIPMEGKLFWLRSLLSTLICGFTMVVIIVFVAFYGSGINLEKSWIMFRSTYLCEIIYAFLLIIPTTFAAAFLKSSEKVDVYDYETNFNPFYFK